MPPELAPRTTRLFHPGTIRLDGGSYPTASERPRTQDVFSISPPETLSSFAGRVTRMVRRRRQRRERGLSGWLDQMIGERPGKRLDLARDIASLRQPGLDKRRESLSGSTESFPVPELFGMMRLRESSGVLGFGLQDERVAFHLRHGRLARGSSDRPPLGTRLGEILMEWKLLDPRALDTLLKKRPSEDTWLGRALVENGLASKEEIRCALAEQARRLMRRTQSHPAAPFAYVECDVDEPVDGLTFDLDALLIDSAREMDEEAHVGSLRDKLRDYTPRAMGAAKRRS